MPTISLAWLQGARPGRCAQHFDYCMFHGNPGRRHPYITGEKTEVHEDGLTQSHTAGCGADLSPGISDDALSPGQVLKMLPCLLLGPHSRPTTPPCWGRGALTHWMLTSPTSLPRASCRDLGYPIDHERYQPLIGNHKPSWLGSFWWEIPSKRFFDLLRDEQLWEWKMEVLLESFRFFQNLF